MADNKKTLKERVETFAHKLTGKQLIALVLFIGAVAVMFTGKDGWGWLLFIAFLVQQESD